MHSLFLPHGWCMTWNPWLIGLNVSTDALVALSYYSIPAALFVIAWRRKLSFELQPILILFGLFIALCGGGHLIDIVSIWKPIYWFKGFWNAGTAAASVLTAIVLIPRTFDFLRMPATAQRLEREASELRAERSLLQTVIDSLEEGIVLLDDGGKVLVENPTAKAILNQTPGLLEWPGRRQIDQDICSDGHRQIQRFTREAHGYGNLFVLIDLTERLRSEQTRVRLERIISTMKQGFAVMSLDSGTIVQTNESFERMHGSERRGLVNRLSTAVFAGNAEEREQTFQTIREECERSGFWEGETCHVRENGSTFDCASRFNFYQEGELRFLSSIHQDVTEQKRIREESARVQAKLLESTKLESLGVLAGGVAHDFNNLLTGILGNVSLAADLVVDASIRPLLQSAMEASERAAKLTQQLLAYSGRGRFVVEPVHLIKQASEISTLVQLSIPKNVELRIGDNPHLPLLELDVAQIQQLLMNLIINGAEAIGDQPGWVTVRAGTRTIDAETALREFPLLDLAPCEYVWLEVRDSGCGMEKATIDQIFDPFFTTKFTGRGLGLAAVQGIVRGHKGALRVESTLGKGSTFLIYFPVVSQAAAVESAGEKPDIDLHGTATILVADDEAPVRTAASRALRHYGYQVIETQDGMEALRTFERHRAGIALIVLDLTMPNMGGQETLQRLREIAPEVPVILMSGYSESDALQRFAGLELSGFLQKPFTSRALAKVVRQSLAKTIA